MQLGSLDKILISSPVCIYYSFDINFGIDNDFTEYLKDSCWYRSD